MGTPLHIALRYLFAKKSHNVINIISIISAAGIAIGSLSLILILSVYNGFDNSIKQIYESYKADFVVSPIKGKTFAVTPPNLALISEIGSVATASPVLEENVFVRYGNRESIATIRGIGQGYVNHTHIIGNIVEGKPETSIGEVQYALLGEQLARQLGLRVRFLTPLEIYFPKKEGSISITNPMESLSTATFYPSAILRMDGEDTDNILYAGIGAVKELTGTKDNEYTSLEIYLEKGTGPTEADNISSTLKQIFPQCQVKGKDEQNATLYKMMKAEKFAVYLILFFVIAIISINIFSSLSMLITDKREDIQTFLSMGATNALISKIFHLHGFLICFTGCIIGVAAGLVLAVIQQQTGIISIPGNYIVTSYPVSIQAADIIITLGGVSAIGYMVSRLPIEKFLKK